jgi:hypothetical protein
MMTIQTTLQLLQQLMQQEANEQVFVTQSERHLEYLRQCWRHDRHAFRAEDLIFLKNLSTKTKAVQLFLEEQECFADIMTQEDVDDMLGRLYDIVEQVADLYLIGRIHKEIRALIEKKSTLPRQHQQQQHMKRQQVLRSLQATPQTCHLCHAPMVLREGRGEWFWGCSTFPQCWSRKHLPADVHASLC